MNQEKYKVDMSYSIPNFIISKYTTISCENHVMTTKEKVKACIAIAFLCLLYLASFFLSPTIFGVATGMIVFVVMLKYGFLGALFEFIGEDNE